MAAKQFLSVFITLISLVSAPCFANLTDTTSQDLKVLLQTNNDISFSAVKIIRQLKHSTERTIERRSDQGQALNAIHEVFKVSKKDLKVNEPKILTSNDPASDLNLIASKLDVKQLRSSGVWIAATGNLLTMIFESSHFENDFIGAVIDPQQAFAEILSHSQIVDSSGRVIAGSAISPFLNTEVRDFFSVKRGGAQSVRNSGSSRGFIWQLGNLPFAFVTEKSIHPVTTLANETVVLKILGSLLLVVICGGLLYWSDRQNQLSIGNAIESLVAAQAEIQLEKSWILDSQKEIIAGNKTQAPGPNEIHPAGSPNESPHHAEQSPENFN